MNAPRILIADPDPFSRESLGKILGGHGAAVTAVTSAGEALAQLALKPFDVVIAELQQPDMDGLRFLADAQEGDGEPAIIMVTAFGSVADAVAAMRNGAADFLTKPFSDDQLCLAVDKATRTHRLLAENQDLRQALDDRLKIDNLIASDPRMLRVLKTVKAVAPAPTTVLITGESGTGKTLLARAIHRNSPRRDGPFVEVNCGALPESLLESELFGHVRGAFTGAVKDRAGKFEAADTGTIFLDEIGTSSPAFQVKLLRVLQDRILERVGATESLLVDVRVVLATNLDLEQAVAAGNFREDLYYRIHVVSVEMPPLRERKGDIAALAEHFRHRIAGQMAKPVTGITPAAMQLLQAAHWPGNVRQLENVIERAVVLTEHQLIQPEDLPANLGSNPAAGLAGTSAAAPAGRAEFLGPDAPVEPLKDALARPERLLIEHALQYHGGNRNATAASLGINRSTLFNKMRKYGLL